MPPAQEPCESCGKPTIIKKGRFGEFLACTSFPECKRTKNLEQEPEATKIKCPKCNNGEIVVKRSKSDKIFNGCTKYPSCNFASWKKPTKEI